MNLFINFFSPRPLGLEKNCGEMKYGCQQPLFRFAHSFVPFQNKDSICQVLADFPLACSQTSPGFYVYALEVF